MTWGASEWSVFVGAIAAVATAGAGIMALIAAKWTVEATRTAADENSRLLKEQIEVQRTELAATQGALLETNRRDKLHAAYTIFKLAGDVQLAVQAALNNTRDPNTSVIPHFSPDLVTKVEAAYHLQSFLNRDNHIHFQVLDAIVHGEAIRNRDHAQNVVTRINELRLALTPAIVGLPHGEGNRVYGSNGMTTLVADGTADI